MQNNFPKISLLLSTTFFCISLFAFFFFYKMLNNNNQELQLKEEKWLSETLRRDEIRALDHSIKTIEEEKAQLETHFVKSSNIVPFLDTIEGFAPKVNIKAEVTSVDISKDKTELLVGMKASGTFNGLYKFLTLLENSPYELEFFEVNMHQGMELGAGSKNIKIPQWNATFKIKLLSFGE